MGTVEYISSDPLSPEYPSPILIDGTQYQSPAQAIEVGKDPLAVLAIHVAQNRGLYIPYRAYKFIGAYSGPLEQMVQSMLLPMMEKSKIEEWIEPLDRIYKAPPRSVPFITILRPVGFYSREGDLLHRDSILDPPVYEEYQVYRIRDGVLLYVGSQGMFLRLDSPDLRHSLRDIT